MLTLISLVLFGILVSFFTLQNTSPVTLNIAGLTFADVPLFLVILASLLIGFLISGIISGLNSVSSSFQLMGKDQTINSAQAEIENLKNRIHQLELENSNLKKVESRVVEEKVVDDYPQPSFWDRLKHSLNPKYSSHHSY